MATNVCVGHSELIMGWMWPAGIEWDSFMIYSGICKKKIINKNLVSIQRLRTF